MLKKISIVLVLLFQLFYNAQAEDKWYIVSDASFDGYIIVQVLWQGKVSYMNNDGTWHTLLTLNTDGEPSSTQYSLYEGAEYFWTDYNCGGACDGGKEFFFAWTPPEGHFNREIQLKYEDWYHKETTYKTARAFAPGKLGLTASNEEACSEINLKWDALPDNLPSVVFAKKRSWGVVGSEISDTIKKVDGSDSLYVYKDVFGWIYTEDIVDPTTLSVNYNLYRDSILIKTGIIGTSYTDSDNILPGETYNYQIQYVLKDQWALPIPYTSKYTTVMGELSYLVVGTSRRKLESPMYMKDPQEACGDTIRLEWQAYDDTSHNNTISQYIIERSKVDDFSDDTDTIYYKESATYAVYVDTALLPYTSYYYRVKTENSCGDISDSWSDVVSQQTITSPVAPANMTAESDGRYINLNWADSSAYEDEFVIIRYPDEILFSQKENSTSYVDKTCFPCIDYLYTVKASNSCGESITDSASAVLRPSRLKMFDTTSLSVSKGYYSDKIELAWDNENYNIIDSFYLSRTPNDTVFVFPGSVNSFNDMNAQSGVLYNYSIYAQLNCQDSIIHSPKSTDVGFRIKAGSLSGKVEYENNIAASNVEILVEAEDSAAMAFLDTANTSLYFPGNAMVEIPSSYSLELNQFTLQCWVKTDGFKNNQPVILRREKNSGYGISILGNKATAWIINNNVTVSASADISVSESIFTNISATYNGKELVLYVNGELQASTPATITESINSNIYIGSDKTNFYSGYIDEVVIRNIAIDSTEVKLNYDRILSGTEKGVVAYYRMDMNAGSYAFDYASKNGEYYKNHGTIIKAQWSNYAPENNVLKLKGLTYESGNYIVNYLRYPLMGNNFVFTPKKGTDSFDKTQVPVFFGEDVYSSTLNLIDLSSVRVTGYVQYKDSRCMAKGIGVYIDNELAYMNNKPVETDKDGFFEVQMPFGEHRLMVYSEGHVFEQNDTLFENIQEPVSGLEFMDTTKIRVVGRVVGGLREGNKEVALGLSVNNIGKAQIIFESQLGFGCSTDTAYTDPITGEYSIDLLPLNYVIKDVRVLSNPAVDFGTQEIMILDSYLPAKTVYDTIYSKDTIARIDSAWYQHKRNFIYRTPPKIQVTKSNGQPFVGEEYIEISDSVNYTLSPESSGFPIFFSKKSYSARIFVHERYVNYDNPLLEAVDLVPLENATIRINNDLEQIEGETDETTTIELVNETDGDTVYTFTAGEPNFLINNSFSECSFTKAFKIEAEVDMVSAEWAPGNNGNCDDFYRAFVLGYKSYANSDFISLATAGGVPVVKTVLRDPPGSGSSVTLKKGSSFSTSIEASVCSSANFAFSVKTDVVPDIEVDLPFGGPDVTVEGSGGPLFSVDVNGSLTTNLKGGTNFTINESISTSSSSAIVGAEEDLFIGTMHSFIFGTENKLSIINDSLCSQGGGVNKCSDFSFEFSDTKYRVGLMQAYTVHDSLKSTFLFTQNHIKSYLIPQIETMRNALFNNASSYKSNVEFSNPKFGTNNDDAVWGSQSVTGVSGPSYECYSYIDSVQIYNQEITYWENILSDNEKQKMNVTRNIRNIAFEGGGNSYDFDYSTSASGSISEKVDLGVKFTFGTAIELLPQGLGVNIEMLPSYGLNMSFSIGVDANALASYSYTLSDSDQGDYFSVDIYAPNGMVDLLTSSVSNLATGIIDASLSSFSDILSSPVFKLRAGRSLCPWEGPDSTQYFLPKRQISAGTMKREKPELSIVPNIKNNVPASEPAIFTLNIGNASETNETMWYKIKVAEDSNPYGANISLDGKAINGRLLEVPGGASYQMTMTLQKIPGIDNYENIKLLLYSPCEWEAHTNGGVFQAVDTVAFSVYFIPSCSDIAIFQPDDQWTVNVKQGDSLPIIVGEYDKNYVGFKKFQIQYKEAANSEWIGLKSYWNDTTGMNTDEIELISVNEPYTLYQWDVSQVPNGLYDIRAVSVCPLSDNYSEVLRGIIDTIPPHAFEKPHPADGVLSPNDNIQIIFNEDIHTGMLSPLNFDIRGVLNGSELNHDVSITFDGIQDYVSIPKGLNLNANSFTIECWAQRNGEGEEVLFSQGFTSFSSTYLGFNESNNVMFASNNNRYVSDLAITDDRWHHYAFVYDEENDKLFVYLDGDVIYEKIVTGSIFSSGKICLGKSSYADDNFFKGHLHGLRMWNTVRTQSDIVANFNKRLVGKEYGLQGNWLFDEAIGALSKDNVHHRNATIYADWDVTPSGWSYEFSGLGSYLEAKNPEIAMRETSNMTIEFWFNSTNGAKSCLLSNGSGEGTEEWNIYADENSYIHVLNNGKDYLAVPQNYFDGNWHHFAFVVNRMGNTHTYLDGELESISNIDWKGYGSGYLWIGARGIVETENTIKDKHFEGLMDEVRIWNLARTQDQVQRYMTTHLQGDEPGLQFFLPFEGYYENLGVLFLEESLREQSGKESLIIETNKAEFSETTPNIVLNRNIEKVNYTYSHKEDRIILSITDLLKRVENTVLDITVTGVEDMNGNAMVCPETWSAYVDLGQIQWAEQELIKEKTLNESFTFTTEIENLAGTEQTFSIENLPVWLEVSPQSGTIAPLSSKTLTFTVSGGLNIGEYNEELYLYTSFEFDEKLPLTLRVLKEAPAWELNPLEYVYTMNVVGQVKINGVISSDVHDKVAAFVDGECRGIANVEYVKEYDMYEVFLDMYSNTKKSENITLRVWDASKGMVHLQVDPNFTFQSNDLHGSPFNPILIEVFDIVYDEIVLNKGWSWISFNLNSDELRNVDSLLSDLEVKDGTEIKGKYSYDQYSHETGWTGSLSETDGIKNEAMYMIKMTESDIIAYTGLPLVPEEVEIPLISGWNWIGYTPNFNLEINDALATLNSSENDIVKGQEKFAVYDENLGWIGSLEYLSPHSGYMLYKKVADTLIFPNMGIYSVPTAINNLKSDNALTVNKSLYDQNMTIVASISDSSNIEIETNDIVYVYGNGKLHGSAKMKNVDGKKLFFITMLGSQAGEIMDLEYYSANNSKLYVINEQFSFNSNYSAGSVDNPVVLTSGKIESASMNNYLFSCYPTPFKKQTSLEIYIEENSDVTLTVYDGIIRKIRSENYRNLPKGYNTLQWKGNLSNGTEATAGVYYIKIETDEFTKTIKVVKE